MKSDGNLEHVAHAWGTIGPSWKNPIFDCSQSNQDKIIEIAFYVGTNFWVAI